MRAIRILTVFLALLAVPIGQSVATPLTLNHQGLLTDNTGAPLSGAFSLTFKLYSVATGGVALWSETQTVTATDGLYQVTLGQSTPLSSALFSGAQPALYLGITVGADPELSPRAELSSAPYSLHAAEVDGFSAGPGNVNLGQFSIVGGDDNTNNSDFSSILGGQGNQVDVTEFADTVFDTSGLSPFARSFGNSQVLHPPGSGTVLGGHANIVCGNHAVIVQGWLNINCAAYSFLGDGFRNRIFAPFSSLGSGVYNDINVGANYSVIGGGAINKANAFTSVIAGGVLNTTSANFRGQVIGGGWRNTTSDNFSTIGGGESNVANASHTTVGGGQLDSAIAVHATVSGGNGNTAAAPQTFVGGGNRNRAEGQASAIAGGEGNLTSLHEFQFIGGGQGNLAFGPLSTIGGGQSNETSTWATVGGGVLNKSINEYTFIGGGHTNTANAFAAVIGGGEGNTASGALSTIGGGQANVVQADSAVVGGGINNAATGVTSTISGGSKNIASALLATVGGGEGNIASGDHSTIGGGRNNESGPLAAVGGGMFNKAFGPNSFIGGGLDNVASGNTGAIAGGVGNFASALNSFVGGGDGNNASGDLSTIPGGFRNIASAPNSFAAGTNARALDTCAFVWSDCCRVPGATTNQPFESSLANSFNARALNGFYFLTSCDSVFDPAAGIGSGVYVPPGGSMWMTGSSRTLKKNITPVDEDDILERVDQMPVYRWSYKEQGDDVQHIGPMAEDFYETFDIGENERTIGALDPAGVSLAATKALIKENKELKARLERLEKLVSALADEE